MAFLGAVLAVLGVSDLVSVNLPEEVSQYHWGSQGMIPSLQQLVFYLKYSSLTVYFPNSTNPPLPLLHPNILLLLLQLNLSYLHLLLIRQPLHPQHLGRRPQKPSSIHMGFRGNDYLVLGLRYIKRGETRYGETEGGEEGSRGGYVVRKRRRELFENVKNPTKNLDNT